MTGVTHAKALKDHTGNVINEAAGSKLTEATEVTAKRIRHPP